VDGFVARRLPRRRPPYRRPWSRRAARPASGSARAQDPNAAPAPTGTVPAAEQAVAAKWEAWKAKQPFTGPNAKVDSAPPEQMNRFSWYGAHGFAKPYPGDTKIYEPDQVPGAYIPASDTDG
jgi:hypothetical protein